MALGASVEQHNPGPMPVLDGSTRDSVSELGPQRPPQLERPRPAPELSIVVPTFNERENIPRLVETVRVALPEVAWELIIVDDNSPDGTSETAKRIGAADSRVRCIRRVGRRGLAGACLEGFLGSQAQYVAVMDGDLQHDETLLPTMLEALRSGRAELSVGYDFAYGDGIKREVIDTTPAHVLLPAGHPLAGRDRVFLRDLAREKLILLDLPHSREYFLQLLSSAGLEPEIAHRSRNYETVRAMVAHGHGFSVLNQRPRHDLTYDGRRVATCRIADDVPALRVVIATLPGVRQTARAAALAEAIRGVFRDAASAWTTAASSETEEQAQ